MSTVRLSKAKRWLPIAICCIPGLAAAAFLGVGLLTGGVALGASLQGRAAIAVVAAALLACPLGMALMMARSGQRHGKSQPTSIIDPCCLPGESFQSRGDRDQIAQAFDLEAGERIHR